MIRARMIALLYLVFAGTAVLLLATTMPPLQNADEAAHADRADQISHLGLSGERIADGEIGGVVDSGLPALTARMAALPFHPDVKISRKMLAPLNWGVSRAEGFPNTASYPPLFYLPAAAAAALARTLGIDMQRSLILMRLATGAASIAAAAAAIAIAGNSAIWLFAVLLLPMSLALDAAVSQDGPMLAATALAAALHLHLRMPQARHRRLSFVSMCVLLMLVGMSRPPYVAFAALVSTAAVERSWRIAGCALICAAVVGWSIAMAPHIVLPILPGGVVNPALQLAGLVSHPWRAVPLCVETWRSNGVLIVRSFIGMLGWLDVNLPRPYYRLAWCGLALAAIAAWSAGGGKSRWRDAAFVAAGLIAAAALVALAQYMTWTAVGAPVIDGIQGRYFLAPALLLGVVLARPAASMSRAALWLTAPVLMLPAISIAVTVHALLLRYYLSGGGR